MILEAGWEPLREYVDCLAHHGGTGCGVHEAAEADVYDAVRALLLTGMEEAQDATLDELAPDRRNEGAVDRLRRRIEELGSGA